MFKKVINYTILLALTCSQTALAGGEGQGEHAPEYRGIRRHYQPTPAKKAQDRPRKHLVLRLRTHGKEGGDDHQNPVSVTAKKAHIEADILTGSLQATGTDTLDIIANDGHLDQDSLLSGVDVYEKYGTATIEGSKPARITQLTAKGDVVFTKTSRRRTGSRVNVASDKYLKVARGAVIEWDGNTLLSAKKDTQLDGQVRGKKSATVYAENSLDVGENGRIEGAVARGIGRDVTNNGVIMEGSEATLLAREGHAQNNGEVVATGGGESDLARTDGATAQVAVPIVAELLAENQQEGLVKFVEGDCVASVRGATPNAGTIRTIRVEDGMAVLTTRELSAQPEEGGDATTKETPGALRGGVIQAGAGTLEGKSIFIEGRNVVLQGKVIAKELNQIHAKHNLKFTNGSQTQAEGDVRATADGNMNGTQSISNYRKQESRIALYPPGLYVTGSIGSDFSIDYASLIGAHIEAEGHNNAIIGEVDTTSLENRSKGYNVGVRYTFDMPKEDIPPPANIIFKAPVHLTLETNTSSAVPNPTIGGNVGTSSAIRELGVNTDLAQSYQVNKDNKVNVQFAIPIEINHEQLELFKDNIPWGGVTWGGGSESDLSRNDEAAARYSKNEKPA